MRRDNLRRDGRRVVPRMTSTTPISDVESEIIMLYSLITYINRRTFWTPGFTCNFKIRFWLIRIFRWISSNCEEQSNRPNNWNILWQAQDLWYSLAYLLGYVSDLQPTEVWHSQSYIRHAERRHRQYLDGVRLSRVDDRRKAALKSIPYRLWILKMGRLSTASHKKYFHSISKSHNKPVMYYGLFLTLLWLNVLWRYYVNSPALQITSEQLSLQQFRDESSGIPY